MGTHRSSVTQPAPDTDQAPLLVSCSSVVFTVLFHPKDLMLFSGGEDSDVRVWDLNTKSCVATLKVSPGLHALLQAHLLACTTQATACESAIRFIVTAGSDLHAQTWHSPGPPVTMPCLNEQHNTVEQVLDTLQLRVCPRQPSPCLAGPFQRSDVPVTFVRQLDACVRWPRQGGADLGRTQAPQAHHCACL